MSARHTAYVLYSEDLESDLYAVQTVTGFFGSEDEHSTFRAPHSGRLTESPIPSAPRSAGTARPRPKRSPHRRLHHR